MPMRADLGTNFPVSLFHWGDRTPGHCHCIIMRCFPDARWKLLLKPLGKSKQHHSSRFQITSSLFNQHSLLVGLRYITIRSSSFRPSPFLTHSTLSSSHTSSHTSSYTRVASKRFTFKIQFLRRLFARPASPATMSAAKVKVQKIIDENAVGTFCPPLA
jgi:hypothetical protein